jgi:hypothetical protein
MPSVLLRGAGLFLLIEMQIYGGGLTPSSNSLCHPVTGSGQVSELGSLIPKKDANRQKYFVAQLVGRRKSSRINGHFAQLVGLGGADSKCCDAYDKRYDP